MRSLDHRVNNITSTPSPRQLLLPLLIAVLEGCATTTPSTTRPTTFAEQYERMNQTQDAMQDQRWIERRALAAPELVAARVQTLQARLQSEVAPFFVLHHLNALAQEHQATYDPDRYNSSDSIISDQAIAIIEAHLNQKLHEWRGLSADEIDTRFALEERRVTTAISNVYNALSVISRHYHSIEGDIFNSIPFADPTQRHEIPQIVRLRQQGYYQQIELMLRIMGGISYRRWHVVHGVMTPGEQSSNR